MFAKIWRPKDNLKPEKSLWLKGGAQRREWQETEYLQASMFQGELTLYCTSQGDP